MALIDVTPIMSSNTTPSGFITSASSVYDNRYAAWQAFNGTNKDGYDGWYSSSEATSFLKIECVDYPLKISKVIIENRNGQTFVQNISLMGSNDDKYYFEICRFNTTSVANAIFENNLNEKIECKYYKFVFIKSVAGYSSIAKITFLYDERYNTLVSRTNAFHAQTLPMNTTQKILAKSNDRRLGFMGIANDGDNFGTAYVVDPNGNSKMMMAGMRSDVLFEGEITTTGTFNMAQDITKYKTLVLKASYLNNGTRIYETDKMVDVSSIKGTRDEFILYTHFASNANQFCTFTFIDGKLVIHNNKLVLTKVIGIY